MRLSVVPVLLVLVLALGGCGGGSNEGSATTTERTTTDETTSGGGDTTLQLAADPTGKLEFDKTRLEAPAGGVTIDLTNDSSVPHDIAIEGNGVDAKSDVVENGGTTHGQRRPQIRYLHVLLHGPRHEEAGMKGTLIVK